MTNVLLRGISACEGGGTPQKAEVRVSSLYEKIAVLIVACAAMVSAALGDARWYAGDGCLTDLEKWTENPVHPKEDGGDGPWVYFMKSSEGSLDYTVTLGADLRIRALFQSESDLSCRKEASIACNL